MKNEEKYNSYLYEYENKDGSKYYKGVLTYEIPNPNYLPKPTGEDTRTKKQKRKTIQRQLTKRFDVKTKAQANKALSKWKTALEEEENKPQETALSVTEYIQGFTTLNIEPSTLKGYQTLAKLIDKYLPGSILMAELTGKDIDAMTLKMQKAGLSKATIAKTYKRFKHICTEATRKDDLEKNPFDKATPPKSPEVSPNALTDASYKRLSDLLNSMEATPFKVACQLSLYCGLRAGEICAIKWSDIDFKLKTLRIQRAIGRGKGENSTYVKEPKTKSSKRTLPLSDEVLSVLRERLDTVRVDLMISDLSNDEESLGRLYVIGEIDGRYFSPDRLSRKYKAMSENFNLMGTQERLTTFHDLRHSFATVAVAQGADVKSIASYLGHAKAAVTLDIYADADQQAKKQTAEKVEKALKDKRNN